MDDENAREGLKDLRWYQRDKGGGGILAASPQAICNLSWYTIYFPSYGRSGRIMKREYEW
jgi:hypothetical protein